MYNIIDVTTGISVGMVENPVWIVKSANGSNVRVADIADAAGVAVNSVPYDLVGRGGVSNAAGTVVASQVDNGKIVAEQAAQLDYIAMMADVDLDVLTMTADAESEDEDNE